MREEAYITDKIGAPHDGVSTITETLPGGFPNVYTKRKISSVSSVTEYALLTDTTGTALVSGTTYFTWAKQGRIQRLGAAAFGERVDVVYIPQDERYKRRQCIIDLVRLAIARPALASENVAGEYEYEALSNYEEERQRIVRRLTLNRF